ncbi:MAG: T9SS type A sorting domain-containing protein [Chitinophagaceae bacterium]|nr:T9SS type A sorting domain-containing protein [Chitinophagaceae bacterium]
MKQVIYIFTFIALSATSTNAQMAAGVVASSVVNKTIVAPDVNLKASFTNNAGEISWKGISQMNVRRYELEKSADGENYSYITAVPGTSSSFTIEDRNLLENTNYYRVKIVDADGNYMYSRVALLDTKIGANEIKVLPTQINQKLFIWVPANTSISHAVISDASGRTVMSNTVINNSTNLAAIETANLPAGVYNIKLQTNKGETLKLKFNKQS